MDSFSIWHWISILIIIPLALLPTIIAIYKNHPYKIAIILTNIFGGFLYGLGWPVALIWCFITPKNRYNITIGATDKPTQQHQLKENNTVRDWILEMHSHTKAIQAALDEGRNDEAWRLTHEFQDWCIERINAQHYSISSAGTLLSVPQGFLIKILLAERKYRSALAHVMYQGVLDSRNLKYYPKKIQSVFRKCSFAHTDVSVALAIYKKLREEPMNFASLFKIIQGAISTWA
jgi:hypothetical protein